MRQLKGHVAARLAANIRQQRRKTVYRMKARRHDGLVPCFCCGEHVTWPDATLEHVTPTSLGGTDEMGNLDISHAKCNHDRGNKVENQVLTP